MSPAAVAPAPSGSRMRVGGFTLVELLVAMSVLVLLIVLFAQLMNNAALGVSQGQRRIEEDNEARLVLDRLASDVAGMLRRDDVDYSFLRQSGDDFLSFYTQTEPGKSASGTTTTGVGRTAALVGVRMNTNASSLDYGQLERAAVDLSSAGLTFAPTRSGVNTPLFTTPNSLPPIPDNEYHLLGGRVFRFEICFLYKTSTSPTATLLATLPADATRANLQSLVVAVAVLDAASRRAVTPAQLASLHDVFIDYDGTDPYDASNNSPNIATVWTDALAKTSRPSNVPLPVWQAVRVYQRYYSLQ